MKSRLSPFRRPADQPEELPLRVNATVSWLDAEFLADNDGPVATYERHRTFHNLGSAISWARQKLLKGEFLPGTVEVSVSGADDKVRDFEILLDGVRELTYSGRSRDGAVTADGWTPFLSTAYSARLDSGETVKKVRRHRNGW